VVSFHVKVRHFPRRLMKPTRNHKKFSRALDRGLKPRFPNTKQNCHPLNHDVTLTFVPNVFFQWPASSRFECWPEQTDKLFHYFPCCCDVPFIPSSCYGRVIIVPSHSTTEFLFKLILTPCGKVLQKLQSFSRQIPHRF
jgi:hypothetical protein